MFIEMVLAVICGIVIVAGLQQWLQQCEENWRFKREERAFSIRMKEMLDGFQYYRLPEPPPRPKTNWRVVLPIWATVIGGLVAALVLS